MDRPLAPRSSARRLAVPAALLVAAALTGLGVKALAKPSLPTLETSAVLLDTVQRGPFVRQVEGPGVLEADGAIWLSAEQPGRVERVRVKAGVEVKSGDVLLELSNPDLRLAALEAEQARAVARGEHARVAAALADARALREGAVATLAAQEAEARGRREQSTRLLAEGLESRTELMGWQSKASELEAKLKLERRRLDSASREERASLSPQAERVQVLDRIVAFRREQLDALHVRAPADGVVQELMIEPGQWITVGTVLGKVIQPRALRAALQIAESSVSEVQAGQSVRIEAAGAVVTGRVARVAPSAKAGTVRVEVALDTELPPGARPDARVHGAILLATVPNALSLRRPPRAVPHEHTSLFRQAADGTLRRVPVQLGAASATHIEVLAGLTEGDRVVVSDLSRWEGADSLALR